MSNLPRDEFLYQIFEEVIRSCGVKERGQMEAYHWNEIPKQWEYVVLEKLDADIAFCTATMITTPQGLEVDSGWRGYTRLRVGKRNNLMDEWDKDFAEIWIDNNPYQSFHAEGFDNLLAGYRFAHDYAFVASYILSRVVSSMILTRQEYEVSPDNTHFQDSISFLNQTQGLGRFGQDPEPTSVLFANPHRLAFS